MRTIKKIHNWGIKQLLGVRMTTSTDVCYVQLEYPPLKSTVCIVKTKLFQRLWEERCDMPEGQWAHAVRLTMTHNTPVRTHIDNLINNVAAGIESNYHLPTIHHPEDKVTSP